MKKIVAIVLTFAMMLTGCSGNSTGDGQKDVSKEQYAIFVQNQKGEVLSGVSVVFNGAKGTTGNDGTATFEKPSVQTVSVTASLKGYLSYKNGSMKINDGNASSITLSADSLDGHKLSKATFVRGEEKINLLDTSKKINVSDTSTFSLETAVVKNSNTVAKYELCQKTDKGEKTIANTTNGTFANLKANKFSKGTGIFVKVKDKSGYDISTSLNLEIGADTKLLEDTDLEIGDEINISLGDDVPVFGGGEVSVSLPNIPVVIKKEDDKVIAGFNVNKDSFDVKGNIDEYKGEVDKLKRAANNWKNVKNRVEGIKKYQKNKNILKLGKFVPGDIETSVSGYVEAGYDADGNISQASGNLVIIISGDAEMRWQTVVVVVPVVVTAKGEFQASTGASVAYSFNDNKLIADVNVDVSVGITLQAGVGFSYLSAGVYGGMTNDFNFILASTKEKAGFKSWDITSDVGLYATAGIFDYKKPLKTGNFNVYSRDKEKASQANVVGSTGSDMYSVESYSLLGETKSDSHKIRLLGSDLSETNVIDSDLTNSSVSGTASDGNTSMTAYTVAKKDQNGIVITQIKYSFNDGTGFESSDYVNQDEKIQMNPSVFENEGKYYLLYQSNDFDTQKLKNYEKLSDEEVLELNREYWKNSELVVREYVPETGEFKLVGNDTVTKNSAYEYNASMVFDDGNPNIIFVENSEGDMFGNKVENQNKIALVKCKDNAWGEEENLEINLNAVPQLVAGSQGDSNKVLYTVDGDNDLNDQSDAPLYISDLDGSRSKLCDGNVAGIKNVVMPDSGEKVFSYCCDNVLNIVDSKGETKEITGDFKGFSSDYAISENAIYFVKNTNSNAEIYGIYPEDGSFSKPVKITDSGNWNRNINVITLNDNDYITCMLESYKCSDNEGNISTQYVSYKTKSFADLAVVDVYADEKIAEDLKEIPVEITLKNEGNIKIENPAINIKDQDDNDLSLKEMADEIVLLPGEEKKITFYVLKDANAKLNKFTVYASINQEENKTEDISLENNEAEINMTYCDFVVSCEVKNPGTYNYLYISVKNDGNMSGSGKLQICDANNHTKVLDSKNISSLEAGQTILFKVNIKDSWYDKNGRADIFINMLPEDENAELYLYNNYSYEYVVKNYGKYSVKYVLNGGKNNSSNPTTYSTTDEIQLKNPSRSGYTFSGWFTSSKFAPQTELKTISVGSAKDLVLYAKWTKIAVKTAAIKVGTKKTVGKLKYKVTSSSSKKRTVEVYGVKSKKMKSAVIPKQIKIGKYYFTVDRIATKAFANCKKLTKITMSSKMKTIKSKVFYKCKALKIIRIESKLLTSKTVKKDAFKSVSKKTVISVPKKKVKAYTKLLRKCGISSKTKIKKI